VTLLSAVAVQRLVPPLIDRMFNTLAPGRGRPICAELSVVANESDLFPKLADEGHNEGWQLGVSLESVPMRTDPLYKFLAVGYVRLIPTKKKS
jgi:hypothetical protein